MQERQASPHPLPSPTRPAARGRGGLFTSTPRLSFSQGLGIGAHSRKHILVSPGGQGARERLCLGGQRGERRGPGVTGTWRNRLPGSCRFGQCSQEAGTPRRPLRTLSCARVPKWELRGFHTFLPQRWLDSLLRFLPAYSGPRAGVQAGGTDLALMQPVQMEGVGQETDGCLTCHRKPKRAWEEESLGLGPFRERQDRGGESRDKHSETRPGNQGSVDTGPWRADFVVEEGGRKEDREDWRLSNIPGHPSPCQVH